MKYLFILLIVVAIILSILAIIKAFKAAKQGTLKPLSLVLFLFPFIGPLIFLLVK